MLLRLVLWAIGFRIGMLSKNDKKFQYAVREKNVVIQFALQNGKPLRYYEFNSGEFVSVKGWHPSAGESARLARTGSRRILVFSFESAMAGLKLLLKGSSDKAVFLSGMRDKQLKLAGDFTLFIWFGWLAAQL